ncbi:MAG TPA: pitrilysin family protein [Acidobacteriota bacterium]|nr:pitrilysin family protein [Acidobacteriota bacterium]
MQRTIRTRCLPIALVCCIIAGSLAFGQSSKPQIPAHPRDLKFPALQYTPPKASAYRRVLNNGVVGYFVEDHDLPLVNISVTVRVGPYLDPAGKEGLAAAVASQMRAGGTARYKAEEFDEEADFLAAEISSGMGRTSATAAANFMAKDTDKALELFFDMLRNPAFQQDRLDLFKSQQLQGIERRNDRTEEIEAREWNRLLRGEKHFTSVLSTKASIESLTRDDLVAFHKNNYQPRRFIFAVSGDFQTAEMKAKIEKAMAEWVSDAPPIGVPKPNFTPVPGLYMVNKPDVNQGRVSIGHLGIMRGNPDEFALDMMNDVLGGSGFTSRIMNKVRTDEGLAYSAGSNYVPGIYYEGQFRAAFQSKSSTAAQAAQIVIDEIDRIRREKVSAEELETVKNQAIEVFPRYFATASAVAETFADDEFTGREPGYWDTYRDKIKAVTVDDILRVAQKYLHPDQLVILAVGNTDDLLKADPDKPQFSFQKMAGGKITRIPLPDPETMVYPK